jgi:NAD(P)-dependent dehydrogenase (short-subunit alcohol dehydrogenase family)
MVNITAIKQSNEHFASEHHEGLVCVFAGATSGVGASTLERMATMLQASTFYVIGRSEARFQTQCAKIANLNSSCKVVFLKAEVSLLSDVDAACRKIIAAEKKVDYLYMSPGMIPLNGPQCTHLQIAKLTGTDMPQTQRKVSRRALRFRTSRGCGSSRIFCHSSVNRRLLEF